VAPVNGSKDGFMFTSVSDPSIQVHIPATVTTLEFTSGGSLGLSNNGTVGTITDTTSGMDHTITIASGTTESDIVVLSTSDTHTVTVVGQTDTAGKTDAVKFDATVDVNLLSNYFTPGSSLNAPMTLTVGAATAIVSDVEAVHFANAKVLIVGAGGYASLTEASAAATGGEVIYVADKSLADGVNGVINHSDISIYIANGDGANMKLADNLVTKGEGVRIYGEHSFNLTGTSGADTIHDYTNLKLSTQTNNIYGMDGADNLASHSNDKGTHILTGGSGADILVGGSGAQLLGGDGNDSLMAFGGAALLSGGAGDDLLLNAYGGDGKTAVNMIGGSGSDTFGLISSDDAAQSGTMKTVVTDLGTGDKIDLSFVESSLAKNAGTTLNSVADFTAAGGKATMATSGTTLNFGTAVVTSTDVSDGANYNGETDVNSHVAAGTMVLSNATLTKVSTAINAADDSKTDPTLVSHVDFNTSFGQLTDTYNHHG